MRPRGTFGSRIREFVTLGGCVLDRGAKIGDTGQTLNEWVKKAEVDSGVRVGLPNQVAEKLKALRRENQELRQANEILRKELVLPHVTMLPEIRALPHPF